MADIETKAQVEIDAQANSCDASSTTLPTQVLKPKKTAVSVRAVVLAWAPYRVEGNMAAW